MSTITDTAICVRRWDFSETSQTVSLLTREHGIIRGIAKGAKRENGNFSGGLDVLTRGEMIASVKTGRELALITAWHLQEMYRALRQNLAANKAALYMADLVHHMLAEHDPHPIVFDALVNAFDEMADAARINSALLRFQWTLLNDAGYKPELDRDARSGADLPKSGKALAFSAQAGGIISDADSGEGWRVRRETIELLRRIDHNQLDQAGDTEVTSRANRLLAAYFREIIGEETSAMRWAFSDLRV